MSDFNFAPVIDEIIESATEWNNLNRFSSEWQATFELLRAAPEMYEALEKVSTWLIAPDVSKESIDHFRRIVRSVIAKVEDKS